MAMFLVSVTGMAVEQKSVTEMELLLSGNEIDLLVGAPVGIVEPLDQRRTRHSTDKQHDFSNLLEDDLSADVAFSEMAGSDAEDSQITQDQAESQLLDLLSETEELEQSEKQNSVNSCEPFEAISTDNIETEFKL